MRKKMTSSPSSKLSWTATNRNNASFLPSGVDRVFCGSLHTFRCPFAKWSTLGQNSNGRLDMTTTKLRLLTIVLILTAMGSSLVQPSSAYARQHSGAAQDTANPTIESVSDTLAFISWTTANPGGTILHYAVVRFGKNPNHLEFTAKSPTRINPSHKEMVFR